MTSAPDPAGSNEATPLQVPQLNANDAEAKVAALFVDNGQRVEPGAVVCEIETTKAVEELVAETSGFIAGLSVVVGDTLTVGATLCWIAPDPEWEPPPAADAGTGALAGSDDALRITGAARTLAAELSVDLARLPTDRIITTEMVRSAASGTTGPAEDSLAAAGAEGPGADSSSIVVYGAGGHGKTLIDLLRVLGSYRIVGVIDDGSDEEAVFGVPVVGGADKLEALRADGIALGVNAVGTIGAAQARLRVAGALARAGFLLPTLVHPSAIVEPSALLGRGAQILAQSYIGSDVVVGPDCIVNTGAIVSHDCTLGHHVHLTPGAILAGGVHVGDRTLIGMGATVFVGVSIGADVLVGNGARIHGDVPDSTVVPTGTVWAAMIAADDLSLFERLYTIRRFEETVLEKFGSGVFSGTTHTYLGQEANAVAVLAGIADGDTVCSNHRCHGHFLAYGGEPHALFAEMMGRVTGVCNGRGGSQHLLWRNFYANGILGGMVPVATGMAMAAKRLGEGNLSVVFLGDGALGEGVVYEALNMASLWRLPILYVLENNHVAQATPTELEVAGSMVDRFRAFGIECAHLDTSDVRVILDSVSPLLDEVRNEPGPRALVIDTWRFGPHSKGDDLRPAAHLEDIRATRDPVTILGDRLDASPRRAVTDAVDAAIARAFELAVSDSPAESVSEAELSQERSLEGAPSR